MYIVVFTPYQTIVMNKCLCVLLLQNDGGFECNIYYYRSSMDGNFEALANKSQGVALISPRSPTLVIYQT